MINFMSTGNPDPKPPQPLNQEKASSLSERQEKVKRIIERLYKELPNEKADQLYDKIRSRAAYLERKYPDYRMRKFFHALIFSGIDPIDPRYIEDDFPGEDSIEAYVDGLLKEYLP